MRSKTVRTVRVTGVPQLTEEVTFLEVAERLSSSASKNGYFVSSPPAIGKAVTSLSPQFEDKVGTITLPSEQLKCEALWNHKTGWSFDDKFDGLTVLYSPAAPELDICAVHGLNGNAFETWTYENNMWLCDFLPQTEPFDRSRVMTFGYNSQARDNTNLSGLKEWADDLLDRVSSVRQSEKERARPIIFVCHSLGSLVAREAIIRLNAFPKYYNGIKLNDCGLLFLSTPHSGSTEADWNKYLVDLAEPTFGVRSNAIVNVLRSFNPQSTNSKEAFANMTKIPPYECLYETKTISVKGIQRHIVTQDSAGLNGQTAFPMSDADHKTICKFESKFKGGYRLIVNKLGRLRTILLSDGVSASPSFNPPGHPRPVAPRYPRARGRPFYEGKYLCRGSQLKGRNSELETLKALLGKSRMEKAGAVAITGIGGIGKTEVLLELASRHRNQADVFFLSANDQVSLQKAYLDIAKRIGHDLLSSRYPKQDLYRIWRNMTAQENVEAFKDWLADPDNTEALFIVDDLDGFGDTSSIIDALPRGSTNIVFSTRKPVLCEEIPRKCYRLRLSPMKLDEILAIMEAVIRKSDFEHGDDLFAQRKLWGIAGAVQGHPLAASHAIKYIIHEISHQPGEFPAQAFLNILSSSDYEARRRFLDYKPGAALSIMETFEVSRRRLRDPRGRVWRLMQLLSFLETDDILVNFRDFFYSRSYPLDPQEFPDHEILAGRGTCLSEDFAEIENVSFGLRSTTSKPFQFHPLWLECTRQLIGSEGRMRCLRQILLICHQSSFFHHVQSCLQVCASFRIELHELQLPEPAFKWINEEKQRRFVFRDVVVQDKGSSVVTEGIQWADGSSHERKRDDSATIL